LFAAAAAAENERAARGPLHRLTEALGLIPAAEEDVIKPELRRQLKGLGVKAGRFALFLPSLLKPRAAPMRAWLWALQHGAPASTLPPPGLVTVPVADWPAGFAEAMGWVQAGAVMLRLDVAERVAADLAWRTRRGPAVMPPDLSSRCSVRAELLPVVLRRLGFRIVPAPALEPAQHGPPAPVMVAPLRRRRQSGPPKKAAATRPSGPFAPLAALKR
jgi:ATP-dependent RNA helicase SUPV3L1/SUV3